MTQASRDVAIRASGISKSFLIPHEARSTIREYVLHPLRRTTYESHEALSEVTFSVRPGEFFGVIGRNGSGKSTLLKILAGIYRADDGSVEVNGKLSPFIELGVGFNPELNARDNIRINGTLLGLSPRELGRRFDDIVAFAELERFVDQSLKNYSSGMQLRLAFAIAIQVPFDILLLDEVLAVGDQNFQEKCFAAFGRMRAEGKTVVLVTHGLDSVARFCDRALLLRDGVIQSVGAPGEVIDLYLAQEQDRLISSGSVGVEASDEAPRMPVNGALRSHEGHQALRELELVVQRSRDASGRQALSVLEGVIRDQEARLEDRAARLSQIGDLQRELEQVKRDVLQLSMMTEVLTRRHYEPLPLPPSKLRARIGKSASELNFLAQGLTAADRVLEVFGEAPQGPILEWGCASGRVARWLVSYPGWRANYHGCDRDEEALTWLAEQGQFRVQICGSDPPLPYSNEAFDGVFAFTALTRLRPGSHRAWYAELGRILRPGGRGFVATLGPSAARRSRRVLATELEARGHAHVPGKAGRSAAFVSKEFTADAVAGLFAVESYGERSYGVADIWVLRRIDEPSGGSSGPGAGSRRD